MSAKSLIIRALQRGPMSVSDVNQAVGDVDKTTVRKALSELVSDGLASFATESGTKTFRLTRKVSERTGTNPFEWQTYQQWEPS